MINHKPKAVTVGVCFKHALPLSFCVTMMFRNLADGLCAARVSGAARRRRDRRQRAFLKHERISVAVNLATVRHHSLHKVTSTTTTPCSTAN